MEGNISPGRNLKWQIHTLFAFRYCFHPLICFPIEILWSSRRKDVRLDPWQRLVKSRNLSAQVGIWLNTWITFVAFKNTLSKYTFKQARKARRCDSYLQIWNYESLTHSLTHSSTDWEIQSHLKNTLSKIHYKKYTFKIYW